MEPWLSGGGARCHAPVGRGNPSGLTPGEHAADWPRLQHRRGRLGRSSHLASSHCFELTWRIRVFALIDVSVVEFVEFSVELYVRREDAERTLVELLGDEPSWERLFQIEEIELGELSWN
jgi:hypothetical protein